MLDSLVEHYFLNKAAQCGLRCFWGVILGRLQLVEQQAQQTPRVRLREFLGRLMLAGFAPQLVQLGDQRRPLALGEANRPSVGGAFLRPGLGDEVDQCAYLARQGLDALFRRGDLAAVDRLRHDGAHRLENVVNGVVAFQIGAHLVQHGCIHAPARHPLALADPVQAGVHLVVPLARPRAPVRRQQDPGE